MTGTIPSDPNGIHYKAGPAKFQGGEQAYQHWLEGDGAVVRLEWNATEGTATFLCRFVQTESFLDDEQVDLCYSAGNLWDTENVRLNAFDTKLKQPCNTNAVRLGNHVLALRHLGNIGSRDAGW